MMKSNSKEGIKLKGTLCLRLNTKKIQSNLVVEGGYQKLIELLMGLSRGDVQIGIGTSGDPSELTTNNLVDRELVPITGNVQSGTYRVRYFYTVPFNVGNGKVIREMGLFMGNRLFSRVALLDPVEKTQNLQFSGYWEIEFLATEAITGMFLADDDGTPIVTDDGEYIKLE